MLPYPDPSTTTGSGEAKHPIQHLLQDRQLIIASNHGPVTFHTNDQGKVVPQRSGGGGLVTALSGLAQHVEACWIASAISEEDKKWEAGLVPMDEGGSIRVQFITPEASAYEGFYRVISNPLLWFLQHSMWDIFRSPTFDRNTWQNWRDGVVAVNRLFAEAISRQIQADNRRSLVILQDYHLYLVPNYICRVLRPRAKYTLTHFIHIPWPGAEDWGFLPPCMRRDDNKLVRDRIPEIIEASSKRCGIETMPDTEYRQALLEKLVEEAQEARQAAPDELITELADLQEVIAAVLAAWQISLDLVQQVQRQRHAGPGGFEQRLKLLWTEDGEEDV